MKSKIFKELRTKDEGFFISLENQILNALFDIPGTSYFGRYNKLTEIHQILSDIKRKEQYEISQMHIEKMSKLLGNQSYK